MSKIAWKSGISGTWETAADWSTGTIPGAGDDVTIAAPGTYTITIDAPEAVNSLTIDDAGASIRDYKTLTIAAALTLTAGDFTIEKQGNVTGGKITVDHGAIFTSLGGTLSGVSFKGKLGLGTKGASIHITDGFDVSSSGGALISDTGTGATLNADGTQTFDNATLDIGNDTAASSLSLYSTTSGTLTLGQHFSLVQTGTYAQIDINSGDSTNALVNLGTIIADASGGTLSIYDEFYTGSFTNEGTIAISNGEQVYIDANVTAGGLGSFSTESGGRLILDNSATLNNAGAMLTVGLNDSITLAGIISGGEIVDSGSGINAMGGTLSAVSYQGTLILGDGAVINIENGLNAAATQGASVINDTGKFSYLDAFGAQTLDNATINLGNDSGSESYLEGDALVVGKHLSVIGLGNSGTIVIPRGYGNTLTNEGTITAATSGGLLTISCFDGHGSFINQGILVVDAGAELTLAIDVRYGLGNFTTGPGGTLYLASGYAIFNAGNELNLGAGAELGLAGSIDNGKVVDSGGGLICDGGTLDAISLFGTVTVAGPYGGAIGIKDGLNIFGFGAAATFDVGAGEIVRALDTQTIDNADFAIADGGEFSVASDVVGPGVTLTFGPNATATDIAGAALLSFGTAGSASPPTFVNQGTISTVAAGATMTLNGDIFTNQGSLIASNGGTISLAAVTTFTNLAAGTLAGGSYEVDANSTLVLPTDAGIATDSANIILSGAGSAIEWLDSAAATITLESTLATIAAQGSLTLLDGRDYTASANAGTFTDQGLLALGGTAFTAAALDIAATGTVAGNGSIDAAVTNAGLVEIGSGSLSFLGGLTNDGTIAATGGIASFSERVFGGGTVQIGAAGTAEFLHGAPVTQTAEFLASTGLLDLAKPGLFAARIADFGGGDRIDLLNTEATSLHFAGDTLTVQNGTATVAALHFQGSYTTDNFTLTSDTNGGSLIIFHN